MKRKINFPTLLTRMCLTSYLAIGLVGLIWPELGKIGATVNNNTPGPVLAATFSATVLFMLIAAGIDKRISQKMAWGWAIFGFWFISGLHPAGMLYDRSSTLAIGYTCLALFATLSFWLLRQREIQQPNSGATPYTFSANHSAVHFLCCVPLLFLCTICYAIGAGAMALPVKIAKDSAGFLRLDRSGLYVEQRSYTKGDKAVVLNPMVHIAMESFYTQVAQGIPAQKTIVLTEGVSDKNKLLKSSLNYDGAATAFGLSSQAVMKLQGNLVTLDQKGQGENNAQGRYDIAVADVDISDFSPETIELINEIGEVFSGKGPLAERLNGFTEGKSMEKVDEQMLLLETEILEMRNQVVIEHAGQAFRLYDTIVIPWGAQHMVGIEKHLLEQGYALEDVTTLTVVDFARLPFESIRQKAKKVGQEMLDQKEADQGPHI